jgi:hypothetical protein
MMRFAGRLVAASTLTAAAMFALPASASVASQNFDSPILPAGSIQYSPDEYIPYNQVVGTPAALSDVTFSGFSGIIKDGAFGVFPNAPSGNQAAFLQSYSGGGGAFTWHVSGLTVGQSYILSFQDTASNFLPGDPSDPFTVTAFGSSHTYAPTLGYSLETLDFTALASIASISFVGADVGPNYVSAIDSLDISAAASAPAPIPEPLTLSLFGAGLAGAAALRRRRKAKL